MELKILPHVCTPPSGDAIKGVVGSDDPMWPKMLRLPHKFLPLFDVCKMSLNPLNQWFWTLWLNDNYVNVEWQILKDAKINYCLKGTSKHTSWTSMYTHYIHYWSCRKTSALYNKIGMRNLLDAFAKNITNTFTGLYALLVFQNRTYAFIHTFIQTYF